MTIAPHLSISRLGRPVCIVDVKGATTIGCASDSDIVLDEATVSRSHALLFALSEHMALIDLDSTDGTFVNGVQVLPDEVAWLNDGDVITLGQVVVRYHSGN